MKRTLLLLWGIAFSILLWAGDVTVNEERGQVLFSTGLSYTDVYAVGNGEENWLNDAYWEIGYSGNKMTKVEDDVYEIVYENVAAGTGREVIFAIDGTWANIFGGSFVDSGVATDAVYNGTNITFDNPEGDITLRLDLRDFSVSTWKGAKFTISFESDDTYVVAGTPKKVFGVEWDGSSTANRMEKQSDGTYVKTYSVAAATDDIQLKVVRNGSEWFGDAAGHNISFNMKAAGDFTVTFHPLSNEVTVTGEQVDFPTVLEYTDVYAVGNGDGNWLNGQVWAPDYSGNKMTKLEEGVYEIVYENVPAGTKRNVKFTIDGGWANNFGGAFVAEGVATDAVYDGPSIVFDNPAGNIALRLDLRDFNLATKLGAKFTISFESGDTYVVAGTPKKVFGVEWDGSSTANRMAKQSDGTYVKTYSVAAATDDIQLKVVRNGSEWFGDAAGHNISFNMKAAGDFTVTFHPLSNEVTVTGEQVDFPTVLEYTDVYAVGDGDGNWLNGQVWAPDYSGNKMTKLEEGVYEIVYENVPAGTDRNVKFTIDGGWANNFGGAFVAEGVATDAVYDGPSIVFDNPAGNIALRLDLRDFNFATKLGAKFTITFVNNPGIKGDVNGDGAVDGGDVSIMLEMVLAGGVTDEQKAVADLNGDGDVDSGDISIIVEIVLAGS